MTRGRDKTKGYIVCTKETKAIQRKRKTGAHARTQIPSLCAAMLRASIKPELQASIITHPVVRLPVSSRMSVFRTRC